jgi:hypothetical protein
MGKYAPLGDYLASRPTPEIAMTFADIERVIGSALPPKAQGHRAWWSNNPNNNVMTKVWLDAGFETQRVDMASRRLVFRRVSAKPPERPSTPPVKTWSAAVSAAAVHPALGALKGMLWIDPTLDLTLPADPDWGRD